jgi:RND superfamily putative drug exporter
VNRFARIVAGRRSRWLFLAAWIVAVAALGPLAGKFESAQQNDPASFLPGDSESARVLAADGGFADGDPTTATVVFRNPDGLTADDRVAVERIRDDLAGVSVAGLGAPGPAIPSADGTALLVNVPIDANDDIDVLVDGVEEIRAGIDGALPDGLEGKVTGPAGFSADATKVFGGINSTLLLSAGALVFVLLVLIYRSPVFWVLPLLAVLVAESVVRGLGYLLASGGVVINGQVGGILLVLVFGAGTDYALLLTARYREELRRIEDTSEAMRVAVRQAAPAILASAGTVVAALLCLSFATVSTTAGLGPVGAMGILVAAAAMLTLLPVLLLIGGRRAFWPLVPRYGSEDRATRGAWRRLAEWIEPRRRVVWISTAVALAAVSLGALTLDDELTSSNGFRGSVEAVQGQELLQESFPAGASAPTTVLVLAGGDVDAAVAAARASSVVAAVSEPEAGAPGTRFAVTLVEDPFSKDGFEAIPRLRSDLRAVIGEDGLVGGPTAEEADVRSANERDTRVLVPLVLLVVLAILVVLLRAVVAPMMLMLAVVLSFFAAVGLSLVGFELFTDFAGEDPSYALYAFIFLVALGVDYSIFLMARVREEARTLPTREAMSTSLSVTGGVITSAGVVLAGTFLVLAVLPLVALTQLGVTVAVGVLIDTLIVRSILVPALTFDLDERTWWPSRLYRSQRTASAGSRLHRDVPKRKIDT